MWSLHIWSFSYTCSLPSMRPIWSLSGRSVARSTLWSPLLSIQIGRSVARSRSQRTMPPAEPMSKGYVRSGRSVAQSIYTERSLGRSVSPIYTDRSLGRSVARSLLRATIVSTALDFNIFQFGKLDLIVKLKKRLNIWLFKEKLHIPMTEMYADLTRLLTLLALSWDMIAKEISRLKPEKIKKNRGKLAAPSPAWREKIPDGIQNVTADYPWRINDKFAYVTVKTDGNHLRPFDRMLFPASKMQIGFVRTDKVTVKVEKIYERMKHGRDPSHEKDMKSTPLPRGHHPWILVSR